MLSTRYSSIVLALALLAGGTVQAARQMETLDRGLVAVSVSKPGVFLSWRLLGTDPAAMAFNLYRDGVKINPVPITGATNLVDPQGGTASRYQIREVVDGVEQDASTSVSVWGKPYLEIPLDRPADTKDSDGKAVTYSPGDASVGDLDGDGQYEIVLKWDPSNAKDNSQGGTPGNVYLDAYKLNGTKLWRIDLGRNIRAGAHYTQFMVYDLDGDGIAEIACKTADGTVDGKGKVIGDGAKDWRNPRGYILDGTEYLTVFAGRTGAAITTIPYEPPRGEVASWGDNYGNRVDRFLAALAYLDGEHPSLVMCRGYYTRAVLVAYDFRNGRLVHRWAFDSDQPGNQAAAGQGAHALSVGDVDQDGKDEIVYGGACIDHDGKLFYSTGLGHGDALHLGDLLPDRPGLEVWMVHEEGSAKHPCPAGGELRDARTGELIFGQPSTGDIGRGVAADIDPANCGHEFWSTAARGFYDGTGKQLSDVTPFVNFRAYWDGDLQDELLDGTKLDKPGKGRLASFYKMGAASNNGTKATPCLSADILGDWREEILFRHSDNRRLLLFTTTIPTTERLYTLMHDPQYRLSIAWQNVGYNQPPHLGFFLGNGAAKAPVPDIRLVPLPGVASKNSGDRPSSSK